MIYKSIGELIGNTPICELRRIKEKENLRANILLKLEFLNPGGSCKDRIAKQMLDDYEKKGILKKGGTIIEPTSGNTGIGLSMLGSSRGYRVIIVMPDTMSIERQKLMKAFGAELVLTPGSLGMKGSISKANELKNEIPGSIICGQFENESNPLAHYNTTGPEIVSQTEGNVDFFVAGIGTGGTITGTGHYLKENIENIKIIGVEPETSPLLTKGYSGKHDLQGIGANFIPDVLDRNVYDDVMLISDNDAYETGRLLSKTEGILCGISTGAALCAAIKLAKLEENKDKNIVVIAVDTGDRYLSTEMFK